MPGTICAPSLTGVTATYLKADLVERLDRLNQAVLYKLDDLSEYDVRRPMTSTATNLLGVAFHLASLNAEYFGGDVRPSLPAGARVLLPHRRRRRSHGRHVGAGGVDVGLGGRDVPRGVGARAGDDREVDLDSAGQIPTRPYAKTTLVEMLVHMVDETARHAGHMDIVRELIDGAVGTLPGDGNILEGYDWAAHRERVEAGAQEARRREES